MVNIRNRNDKGQFERGNVPCNKEWSKERVVERLREWNNRLDYSLSLNELRNLDSPLVYASFRYFGTWNGAKKEAGLGIFSQGGQQKWDRKEVLETLNKFILEFKRKKGRIPRAEEDLPEGLYGSVRLCIGRYTDALRMLGFEPNLNIFPDFTMPKLNEDFAYWLGLVFGDGYLRYDKRTGQYYISLGLQVGDKELVRYWGKLSEQLFKIKISFFEGESMYRCFIHSREFTDKIKKRFKPNGRWIIPNEISNSSKDIKSSFISGFFDAEGCACVSTNIVSVSQKNTLLLLKIKDMLESLGIGSRSYKCKNRDILTLHIRRLPDLKRFTKMVGSHLERKQKKLEKIASREYKYSKKDYENAMKLRRKYGWGPERIRKKLNLLKPAIVGWIYKDSKPWSVIYD